MNKRLISFLPILSLFIFLPLIPLNAEPTPTQTPTSSQLEIISISEVSDTSIEILFNSSVPKKSIVNYVITAAVDLPAMEPQNSKTQNVVAIAPKSIKKVIKTKATGLITAEIKNLNPKATYNFQVSAKTNKAKMISSEVVEYSSLSNLMDALSNLPADWGNPKPIPTPTPTQTATPIAAPAFTLSSSSESRTVNTAATGFTITSTGGAIASFAISATPAGMSFSTTTGALTGTPTSVAGATAYTITATNATGSATQTFTLTVAPTAISVAAIAGVTAPVSGATPVSTTTAGTGYTGTVTWSGSPATFAPVTTYTATITLTPTSGYTLTGVTENFFTVAGATSDINPANSGVITAVFPATGYSVGDTGPGGGIVYYVSASNFTSTGSTCDTACKYLEVAPSSWNAGGDPNKPWAVAAYQSTDISIANNRSAYNNALGVGLGYANSSAIVTQNNTYNASTNNYAAGAARAYTGGSKTDWYLPTTAELNLLCQWNRGVTPNVATVCSGGSRNSATYGASSAGFSSGNYWSSSEADDDDAWYQSFFDGSQFDFRKSLTNFVRPVRAF